MRGLSLTEAIDRAGPILFGADWIDQLEPNERNILAKYGPKPHGQAHQSILPCPAPHQVALDRAIGRDHRLGVQRATVLDWIYSAGVMINRNACDRSALDRKLESSKREKNAVGAPPVVQQRVIRQMLEDLRAGAYSADGLLKMKQESMQEQFGASRKVCKQARAIAIAEAKRQSIG